MYPDGMSAYAALLMKQSMDEQFSTDDSNKVEKKQHIRLNRVVDTFVMSVIALFVVAVMI